MENSLEKVKELAKMFLRMPIHESELSPIVVIHPIWQSGIINTKKYGLLNILENPDKMEDAYSEYEDYIDAYDNVSTLISLLITNPYKLVFFKYISKYLNEKEYADALRIAYTSSEAPNIDINVSKSELIRFFKNANKKHSMDEKENQKYNNLPEVITVYRGASTDKKTEEAYKGISWSTSLKQAKWFAERYSKIDDRCSMLVKAKINKKYIVGFFDDEDEVVIDYNKIFDLEFLK